jgi:hypothetical protein
MSPESLSFLDVSPPRPVIPAPSKQTFRKVPSVSFVTPRISRRNDLDLSDYSDGLADGDRDRKPPGILKSTLSHDDFPDTPDPRQFEKERMLREKRAAGRSIDSLSNTETDGFFVDFL